VLVTDLAGHISHFNRRFRRLWELPDEMLLLRADDEVFDLDAAAGRRAARLHDAAGRDRRRADARGDRPLRPALGPADRAHDRAAVQPRRPIGRVFTFRERPLRLLGHRVQLAAAGRWAS
jgi:PAS domain-containing protein